MLAHWWQHSHTELHGACRVREGFLFSLMRAVTSRWIINGLLPVVVVPLPPSLLLLWRCHFALLCCQLLPLSTVSHPRCKPSPSKARPAQQPTRLLAVSTAILCLLRGCEKHFFVSIVF